MKTLYKILIGLVFVFTLNSCSISTYPTTQDDIYVTTETEVVHSDVDYNVVIRLGSPYYYNGHILYYLYNGLYYYPYFYDNYWYMRVYRRPFNHLYYHPYFRPHRYDYRFNHGYRNPYNWYRYTPSPQRQYRPSTRGGSINNRQQSNMRPNNTRPNINQSRPSVNSRSIQRQPSTMQRPSTRGNMSIPNRGSMPSRGGTSRGRR